MVMQAASVGNEVPAACVAPFNQFSMTRKEKQDGILSGAAPRQVFQHAAQRTQRRLLAVEFVNLFEGIVLT